MNASHEDRSRAAVVGIGCRFPGGADTPERFWELLREGRDAIGPMPQGRFNPDRFLRGEPGTPGRIATIEGGFIEGVDRFDASFFGLSPREARKIDPQHRILLEVVWEAMEDAGIVPSSLAGSRTGVYIGLWTGEYENVMYRHPEEMDFHSLTGGGRYSASGRISFALDLRGPCLTVDTGCSSSLVALHLARQALESGEIDAAVVGAANLILQPHVNVGYSQSGMLSPGARCRFGDSDTRGYVRSDGVAAVVLKPLDRAHLDRNPVRGVVLATAVNADGQASGQLATPSREAQAELLRIVYGDAGIEPARIPYVEAHGTGTRAGDPVEISALGEVLGQGRDPGHPLLVGSVKTNIGHTEACAGMAGMIKALLAIEHREIPASLHQREPNPEVDWAGLNVRVAGGARPWPADAAPMAGVSSFGITGTNAHAVLAAPEALGFPVQSTAAGAADRESDVLRPRPFVLSGRSEAALKDQARNLLDRIEGEGVSSLSEISTLSEISATLVAHREHHLHRLGLAATSLEELRLTLGTYLDSGAAPGLVEGRTDPFASPRLGFIFSGQGSQWLGMGRELLRIAPAFRETLEACDAALEPHTGWSLLDVLGTGTPGLERVDIIQPVLGAVQIALARQLEAWGIVPEGVAGHSMGEVPAAHVAGSLTLEEAMQVLAVRSRLLSEIAGQGAMALLDLEEDRVRERLRTLGARVSVAAVNGPRSTVVSGDPEGIDALLAELDRAGVFGRRVRVDVASHSAQTEPLLQPLRAELDGLAPIHPTRSFFSTVLARPFDSDLPDAEYWTQNLRRPVRLAETVQAMIATGIDTFVEIAPHPILLSSLADIAAGQGRRLEAIPLQRREEPEEGHLLHAVLRLHALGVPVNWSSLIDPEARPVRLPTYPWQRESHWLEGWEDWSGEETDGSRHVPRRPEEADQAVWEIAWGPVDPSPLDEPVRLSGRWILLADSGGVSERLAHFLEAAGGKALPVPYTPGVAYPEADGIAGTTSDAFEAALADAGSELAGIIDLWGLDALTEGNADAVEGALARSCGTALWLGRTLAERGIPVPGTWWVTRGAVEVGDRSVLPGAVAQSALWGFVRTLGQDHPEFEAHLVDLDPAEDVDSSMQGLLRAIAHLGHEHQVAFAGSEPRVARIGPAAPEATRSAVRWRKDATYLITGGLGALGREVAAEMVRGGAARFLLVGRSSLPPRSEWTRTDLDPEEASRVQAVMELERLGASVHLLSVDVADESALAGALSGFASESWPPIVGLVHCAGVIDNRLTWEGLLESARAKSIGGWNLYRHLPELEQVILFSSAVSGLPQPAQANYAAANAFLDGLASAWRPRGVTAVSLGWGVWKDVGLARGQRAARYQEIMHQNGLRDLSREAALALFSWTGASPRSHLILTPVDWEVVLRRTQGRPGSSFYQEQAGTGDTAGQVPSIVEELAALPGPQRSRHLVDRLRGIVGQVLELPPEGIAPTQPLGRQGLDSLMAMEFRNRLEIAFGLTLPASIVWNYPTLGQLAEHLLERLSGREVKSTPDGAAAGAVADTFSLPGQVAAKSEEEVLLELRGGR